MSARTLAIHSTLTLGLLVGIAATGSSPAYACACCDSYAVVGVEDWDVLNVRSKPSARARKVGSLEPGTCGIEVLTERRGWSKIRSGGLVGWVNGKYLEYQ